VLGAMFGMAVADGYLDYNPFHDVKIPKVPGRRAIKVATPEQFLKVRACLPTKSARVFSTLLVSSGLRFDSMFTRGLANGLCFGEECRGAVPRSEGN